MCGRRRIRRRERRFRCGMAAASGGRYWNECEKEKARVGLLQSIRFEFARKVWVQSVEKLDLLMVIRG